MNDVGPSAAKPFATLLLTGAAGALGQSLAPALSCLCTRLLLSDLGGPLAATPLPGGAEAAPCDLGDPVAVHQLLQGVDAVVHLGGVSVERPFGEVMKSILPFYSSLIAALMLVTYVPAFSLWLPGLFK